MTNPTTVLATLAANDMEARGLAPEFSKEVLAELDKIKAPATLQPPFTDLRSLLWCSIDNDDSLDLDQLTYGEKREDGSTDLYIAVADVDGLVKKNSAIDGHAETNTTSVYTPGRKFPMLPDKLSTDLTSLNENQDRTSVVMKMRMTPSGNVDSFSLFMAYVHNHAKLTYNSVGAWLEGKGNIPEKMTKIVGLEQALKWQHEAAQILRKKRHEAGALTLKSADTRAYVSDNQITLALPDSNFAQQLIEEFMIKANNVVVDYFNKAKIASLRRIVRIPKRWDRIMEIARGYGEVLPIDPDSKALDDFLISRQKTDPETFPDLSLTIIKLLGRGEYVLLRPDQVPIGHFGLAVRDYTHATAPNRRYPDLISQRQYKARLNGQPDPYSTQELQGLADHCTAQEDAANKVERQNVKSAAAILLSSKIGVQFKGIVTGASEKGTWVRIFQPPVEGKVVRGSSGLDVGDKVTVKLIHVDIPRGFIDFART